MPGVRICVQLCRFMGVDTDLDMETMNQIDVSVSIVCIEL